MKSKQKRVYRQDNWKKQQYELGNCIICGQPRGDSPFKRLCRRHGLMHRLDIRKRYGYRPWKRGRLGGQAPLIDPVRTQDDIDRLYPPLPDQNERRKRTIARKKKLREQASTHT